MGRSLGANRALAAIGVAGVLAVSCASSSWHVPTGHEHRFRQARTVCRQLTDADGGKLEPERFDTCMKRRGWRHERFYDGWFFKM